MSTKRRDVGTLLFVAYSSASRSRRSSGTGTTPTLGSTVQNGKFAASALADDSELNRVLLPTLGKPTMPHENPILLRWTRGLCGPAPRLYHMPGSRVVRRASGAGWDRLPGL